MKSEHVVVAGVLVGAVVWGCKSELTGRSGPPPQLRDQDANTSYVSSVSDEFKIGPEEKAALLKLARNSVEGFVKGGSTPPAPAELATKWPHLAGSRACFVTLRIAGDLRGCIGSLEPRRSLIEDVRQNAVSAAVHDTRFRPVATDDLPKLDYEISILDLPRPLQGVSVDELPGWLGKNKPGLIIEHRGRRSTFLPSVWEDLPDPNAFLEHLCRKQGSPSDCWRDPATKMSIYGSIKFGEKEK